MGYWGECGVVPVFGGGVFQQRTEGFALEVFWGGERGEVAEGGEEVEEFYDAVGFLSGVLHAWGGDDEGDAGGDFVVGGFSPDAHVAEVPAVIAPEDDDGVFVEAGVLEGLEGEADLGVDVGGAGEVGVEEGAGEVLVDGAGFGDALADAEFE